MSKNKIAPLHEVIASSDQLAEIVALARRQVQLEEFLAELETTLKDMTAIHVQLSQEDLPAAMKEAGLQRFTLDTGETIEVKPDFAVGIAKDDQERAYAWLEEKGYGGLVKTQVVVEFGKGEGAKAQALLAALVKKELNVILTRGVHWQSLKAWVKEMDAGKKKVPAVFGAHPLTKAVIKAPK